MVTEEPQQQKATHSPARFMIDVERLAAQGRSLQLLLLHRRCASCWGTLIQEPAQGLNIDAAEHLEQIARQCSGTPDFIHPELPVMEAVFRILLSNVNVPMTVEAIYETLRERWLDSPNPRTPSLEQLYRLLSGDTFYGIREISETTEGEAS